MTPADLTAPWLSEMLAEVRSGPTVLKLLTGASAPAIAQHAVRTLRYALATAEQEDIEVDLAALVPACLLHDIGATALAVGAERFEVQGADIAAHLLEQQGEPEQRRAAVWRAIALHTSPHIAERIDPLTRLVRLGVRIDFGLPLVSHAMRAAVELEHPRLDVERVLSGVVVEQAIRDGRRAPSASWPANLLAAHRAGPDPDGRLAAF